MPSEYRRPGWITEDLELQATQNPNVRLLEPHEDPDPEDYLQERWKMAVKDGHALNPDEIPLTYYDYTKSNWAAFSKLRQEYSMPDLPYQVGLPGTLEDPMFAFRRKSTTQSLVNGFRHRKPFEIALQRQVDQIWEDQTIGDPGKDKLKELKFQVEVPAEIGGMDKMWDWVQPGTNLALAPILGRGIVRQVAGFPQGSDVIAHPCKGDWKRNAYDEASTALIVTLAKSIIHQWPEGRNLDGIHFPFAAGNIPPSLKASHYTALGRLAKVLPQETRFIAGFVHEGLTPRQHFDIRNRIEDIMQRPVDIAAACGLGRVSLETARHLTQQSIELVT
jgi:hypothetical protein